MWRPVLSIASWRAFVPTVAWRTLPGKLGRAVQRNWQDLLIMIMIAALSLWVRRLTLIDIEAGGDATRKWFFVKQWSYDNHFDQLHEFNHHYTRFGVNFWAYVCQKIWGTDPWVYYVAPVGAATVGSLFTYKVGQKLAGRYAGILAALSFITFQLMERSGSQLLPAVFSAAYIAGAAYFLLLYLELGERGRTSRVLVVVSAVFVFGAYLSKESEVYFIPGFALALWLVRKNHRDLLLFLGVLFGLWLLETAWYNLFTEFHSRYDVVTTTHGGGKLNPSPIKVRRGGRGALPGVPTRPGRELDLEQVLEKLFERYEVLDHSFKVGLFFFLAAGLGLSFLAKNARARSVTLPALGFLFFLTFSIRSLHPLQVWMPNEVRYLIVICPLMMAINAAFAVTLIKQVRDHVGHKWFIVFRPPFVPIWAALLFGAVAYQYYEQRGRRALNPGNVLDEHVARSERFNRAFQEGFPIVETHSKHKKALRLIWSVYLKEDLITKDGKLISFEDGVRGLGNRYDWISKTPDKKAKAKRTLASNRRCAYIVRIRGRYLRTQPSGDLPRNCDREPAPRKRRKRR